jgi:prephenate dehydrogenase
MQRFDSVAIIGCGLLGASLGLALKARGLAGRVLGIGRNQSTLDRAVEVGAIAAAADASLIVIATPIAKAVAMLEDLKAVASPGSVITDVGSTKRAICERAAQLWPEQRPFVGAHPMAGSEKSGPEHARATLYDGAVCFVEDLPGSPAFDAIHALWAGVGARVVPVCPARHDETVAYTSHLPHVAAALVAALAGRRGDVRDFVGNGFRDTTRIAAARPEVWTEICLTNRDAMLKGLRDYEHWLADFRHALEDEDAAALENYFAEGQRARHDIVGRTASPNPACEPAKPTP